MGCVSVFEIQFLLSHPGQLLVSLQQRAFLLSSFFLAVGTAWKVFGSELRQEHNRGQWKTWSKYKGILWISDFHSFTFVQYRCECVCMCVCTIDIWRWTVTEILVLSMEFSNLPLLHAMACTSRKRHQIKHPCITSIGSGVRNAAECWYLLLFTYQLKSLYPHCWPELD